MRTALIGGVIPLFAVVKGANFPFEAEVLTEADIKDFPSIAFGNISALGEPPFYDGPECKEYPGSEGWPTDDEWVQLNASLGGVLLKPVPLGAACYDGPYRDEAKCDFILNNASTSRIWIDDPLSSFTTWPAGDACYATRDTEGLDCTQGGYPVYVVNASTVKHIQAAVNFARNRNLRIVIKNTGHDFIGRNVGFGSLSIWTHWLKSFEFLPEYSIGEYQGRAARVASGIESWEMFEKMETYNATFVVAGGYTVGAYGGWIAGGGHSALASVYGLGSDQVLSLQVVTADGGFLTADPNQNTDLFYALRGGGGSTYGVVTSAIVKAHPYTQVLSSSLAFDSSATTNGDVELFWRGFDAYHAFSTTIADNGGTAYSYLLRGTTPNPDNSSSFTFSASIEFPNRTPAAHRALLQPLFDTLNRLGIPAANPASPAPAANWLDRAHGAGDRPGSSRFASRLLPRAALDPRAHPARFAATQAAIRAAVEASSPSSQALSFHGITLAPTRAAAGWPAAAPALGSAANPRFRDALAHVDLFSPAPVRGADPAAVRDAHARLDRAMAPLREATGAHAGVYLNECDVEEPRWREALFGGLENYGRLRRIKGARDPWGVFYAMRGVGSEGWEVREGVDRGVVTQVGPLCRVRVRVRGG
ncbi:hypothetical protein F4809DRAFT_666588 [Biscogniauxia mediterranea]|nr:hypothetical protein F4809DRAFT_666588 [Biscogniauxia mediterranea]